MNIIAHLPYSPDLASGDYWLSGYIKRSLIDEAIEKTLVRAVSKLEENISEEEFWRNY